MFLHSQPANSGPDPLPIAPRLSVLTRPVDSHAHLEGLLAVGVKEGVWEVPGVTLAHGGCSVARAQLGADLASAAPGSPSSTDCVSK